MFTLVFDDYTTAEDSATEPCMPVTIQRRHDSITFHVGRSPEFLQGVTLGRLMLQEQTWEAENLLRFIQQKLSPDMEAPVHHLGLIAGLLSVFAEAAMTRNLDDLSTFIVACDPEFADGVTDGRTLLPTDWDLSGKNGLWEVGDLLQFVQQELSPASLAHENEVREVFDAPPHTPIYNLALVAGLLSTFADAARNAEKRGEPGC